MRLKKCQAVRPPVFFRYTCGLPCRFWSYVSVRRSPCSGVGGPWAPTTQAMTASSAVSISALLSLSLTSSSYPQVADNSRTWTPRVPYGHGDASALHIAHGNLRNDKFWCLCGRKVWGVKQGSKEGCIPWQAPWKYTKGPWCQGPARFSSPF